MAHVIKCDKCKKCYSYKETCFIKIYSRTKPEAGRHLRNHDICDSCYEAMVKDFEQEGTEGEDA